MLTLVNLNAKKFANYDLFTQSTIAYAPFTVGPIESGTLYGQSSGKSMPVTAIGNDKTLSYRTFDNSFVPTHSLVYSATGNIDSPGYGTFDGAHIKIASLVYTATGPNGSNH